MPHDHETVSDDNDDRIDVADPEDDDYRAPQRNGCWFCHCTIDDDEPSSFSTEFDTFYHDECADELGFGDSTTPVLDHERA